jgi:hypothetical protein
LGTKFTLILDVDPSDHEFALYVHIVGPTQTQLIRSYGMNPKIEASWMKLLACCQYLIHYRTNEKCSISFKCSKTDETNNVVMVHVYDTFGV